MKQEQTECSETTAQKIRTLGKKPKEEEYIMKLLYDQVEVLNYSCEACGLHYSIYLTNFSRNAK